jgi:hypothetical protein
MQVVHTRRERRRVPGRLRQQPGAVRGGLHALFDRLDWLTERLSRQRYLVGEHITEADVRLFTTLARFDAVYHNHFRCNRDKLSENPVLWAYARDLYQTPGFGDTIDFDHIKRHYYLVHTQLNPAGIIPPVLTCRSGRPHTVARRRTAVRRRHPTRGGTESRGVEFPRPGSPPHRSAPCSPSCSSW